MSSPRVSHVEQVIDIAPNTAALRRRRRAILRIAVPLLALVVVTAAVLAIAFYSHSANRKGVLALSDDLLETLDAQIAQRVAAFLDPCARALRIMTEVELKTPLSERRAIAERFAGGVLAEIPQIASFYVGDDDGNFLMQRRLEAGTETKQISNLAGQRRVTITTHDRNGQAVAQREDASDTFDPRARPWYKGAIAATDVYWTGVYIFFSDQKPGITVSKSVKDQNGKFRVFGVDITLQELSRFLATLEIGASGRAVILDDGGNVIAAPDMTSLARQNGDTFAPQKLDQIDDPVLRGAYDRFRVEGQGKHMMEIDDASYIASVTPLPSGGQKWWVLIVVPEEDFVGFVISNNQNALVMSLVVVFAVATLALLLVRQGLKSDRAVRLLMEHGEVIARQGAAYAEIAHDTALVPAAERRFPPNLTESLTEITKAARVSVWHFGAARRVLHCDDSFERDSQGHAGGFELHERELPAFFAALHEGKEIMIGDAAIDPRSAQFYQVVMRPLGSRTLMVVPMQSHAGTVGAICLEDAREIDGTRDFLHTIASMMALRLDDVEQNGDARLNAAEASVITPGPAAVVQQIDPALASADLAPDPLAGIDLAAGSYRGVAVMVLRMADPLALARKAGSGGAHDDLANAIACALQEEAARHGITYLKMVGQQAIAAVGAPPVAGLEDMPNGDPEAMPRIAAFALAVRERCAALFDEAGQEIDFHIGLDCGICFGGGVGSAPRQFNLWGEALETAAIMAASAPPGGIQASAAAYGRLRQDFLFRPRGSFYLPGIGDARTYVLAGQL